MKFVVSYSGGKDSVMALHKMLEQGHTPVGLLVMVNRELGRSWFHGVDLELLQKISDSLGIPLLPCESFGEEYHTVLEEGLKKAKALGAEACVFGDIDIDGHLTWCRERCDAVGLTCVHPLWLRDREENTGEILSLGYRCLIKCVRNQDLPKDYLGKPLSPELIAEMKQRGMDVCGENGEYHTVVVDGPIFRRPVDYACGEILDFGTISAIDIRAK
jgi:diphthine-ammonia ligase